MARRVRYLSILSRRTAAGGRVDRVLLRSGVDRSALLVVHDPKKVGRLHGKGEFLLHGALYGSIEYLDGAGAGLMNEVRGSHWDPELVGLYDNLGRDSIRGTVVLDPLKDRVYGVVGIDAEDTSRRRESFIKDGLRVVAELALEFGPKPEQWTMVCAMTEIAARRRGDDVGELYDRVARTVRTLVSAAV